MISLVEQSNAALNKSYASIAGRMLAQIKALTNAPRSAMQRALKELDEEAQRLADEDERMKADNAVLQKALNENERSFIASQTLINANDDEIQESGSQVAIWSVTAKVFSALAAQQDKPISPAAMRAYVKSIADAGITWNVPSALDFGTDYVDSAAWIANMEGWGTGYADKTREAMLNGLRMGWGPKHTASQARKYAENWPNSAAENLTRTLQLTSYRDSSAAMEVNNNQYVDGKIRVATFDGVTCLTCISLSGTQVPLGDRIDDHYSGRCTEFYQVAGGPRFPAFMQADSKPGDRNFVPYQSGDDWFNSLSASRQAQQASFLKSPAKLRAFRDGTPLSAFVGEHTDDVFGNQFIEKSLIGAIGDDAKIYYEVNQGKVLRETMVDFEQSVALNEIETAAVYSKDGSLLFTKDGTKNSVLLTKEEISKMEGTTLTHNHPSGSSFSKDDMVLLAYSNASEIRAVTNKNIYIMIANKKASPAKVNNVFGGFLSQAQETDEWRNSSPSERASLIMPDFARRMGWTYIEEIR